MVSEYFSESTLKSALSKAKHEFDLAAEMVQLIEQGMVQIRPPKSVDVLVVLVLGRVGNIRKLTSSVVGLPVLRNPGSNR